eukprot:gnl/Dysnectes_brevis/760_a835_7148.p2 GENE.gnl/Dysnectes_brevis/760_a835_7148~~gnl/Dysnectes_brevis/760_a835_7148.p2  ORF type:complete len:305 (-),score=119.01 gnl/Dysnectes_brevis/760_a835_7148:64-978(-)
MAWIAVQKNRSYFKRYQVKYRRRREGKTDYYARKRLVVQDKNKYATPRYRLVVRRTNKDIICQIVSAEINKDRVMCSAYSHELPTYGLPVGLTNFASAYCTGLLVARRVLHKLAQDQKCEIDQLYPGVDEVTGEEYHVEDAEERRAFRCHLDIGLSRATTGANIFGCLKGAVDGGLNIPHSVRRFPGYDAKTKSFEAETLRERIFAGHVAKHMQMLKEENPEAFKRHYSQYIKAGIEAEDLEETLKKVHAAIRADPFAAKQKISTNPGRGGNPKPKKQDLATRQNKVQQKKALALRRMMEAAQE